MVTSDSTRAVWFECNSCQIIWLIDDQIIFFTIYTRLLKGVFLYKNLKGLLIYSTYFETSDLEIDR